jgi:hypothetical protein
MRKVANHRDCYAARVTVRAIPSLLRQVAPFLIVKKKQADNVLEFCRLMAEAPMRTSAYREIFEQLWADNKALNRRGIPQEV